MRHLFITFHPRFTIAPMWVITVRRRYTGVTITGYTIIVIAAVAINPTMHGTVWSISPAPAASPADMIAVSSPCRAGFPVCRQAGSTSTRNGCSSTLAINKTSHCFCSATSNV